MFGVPALAGFLAQNCRLRAQLKTLTVGLKTLISPLFFLPVLCFAIFATPEISTSDDQTTVIVNDAPEQDVIALGKSVIVQKRAKGVLAVGGDVTVEGRVEGDVATIGGNVVQKEGAYIGGEIIVIGGSYKPESSSPLREAGKQTIVLGVFEEELRSFRTGSDGCFCSELFDRFSRTEAVYSPRLVYHFARIYNARSWSCWQGRGSHADLLA